MSDVKPLKLHAIIGTSTVWTDELWDDALTYLLERISTVDTLMMARTLHGEHVPNYPHKVDFLREFRKYPPTVLLGIFDLVRWKRR